MRIRSLAITFENYSIHYTYMTVTAKEFCVENIRLIRIYTGHE